MKTTVFVFHPQLEQGSRINAALATAAKDTGVEVRDMYALYPDFKINVAEEKSVLENTDRIVLQFPVFWYQTTPLLKKWLDDVLEYGWAYGVKGTALQGKELLLAPTFGAVADDYTLDGRFHMTVEEVLKPIEAMKYHTGLVVLDPFVITGTLGLSTEEIVAAATAYQKRLA